MSTEAGALQAEQEIGKPAGGPVLIGLLGHGTVGAAVASMIERRADTIAGLTGRPPTVCGVLTRSSGSFAEILDRSEVVIELIGGIEPARGYVLEALRAGRHVVTANKQLICEHGEELFAAAQQSGVQLRFEAAVAGVVPVVRVLRESLAGIEVKRIHGIVNGTTNFILSAMESGADYEHALAQAQASGFAEADPEADVSGADAAAKMAILARLAFGTPVRLADVRYEGIEHLISDDLQYARELGLSLKLIGTAERLPDGVCVHVHPAFLYAGHPLASIGGQFNAVTVEADAITEITMSGPGAGGPQTASAVLGDLLSVISGAGSPGPPLLPATAMPLLADADSAFYLHMEVADEPGVLVAVAGVLDRSGASVKSVLQRGLGENARLVMVTHPLSESCLRSAVREIGELPFVRSAPRAIRVIEEEF
ncbi:MAG TPA: homoserine dehydrogenase [Solirubrobacteraceae bacterium]|jgi:homoserine dehydrogenase|nr:homoserine dehydrogenase [Solirubrobacteraceae bacterium]